MVLYHPEVGGMKCCSRNTLNQVAPQPQPAPIVVEPSFAPVYPFNVPQALLIGQTHPSPTGSKMHFMNKSRRESFEIARPMSLEQIQRREIRQVNPIFMPIAEPKHLTREQKDIHSAAKREYRDRKP